jgi:cbb3-type cytochrome oxidase maturation protein
MDILVFLVPLALGLGLLGLAAFLWSLNNGQYDDLDGAAWRAIAGEDGLPPEASVQPAAGDAVTDFTKPTLPGRNW